MYNKSKVKMRLKLCIIYSLAVALVSAQQKGSQSLAQLEESPAGSKIIWFLDQVAEGEKISEELVNQYFSPKLIDKMGAEKLISMITQLNKDESEFHLYKVNRRSMFEYKLKLKGMQSKEWFDMVFYFEDGMPYRITGVTIDSGKESVGNETPIYPLN